MIGKPELEYQDLSVQEAVQLEQLLKSVAYLKQKSPFYKNLLKDYDPQSIQQLSDLSQWPTTSKEDLQIHNRDFFCVPDSAIRDINTTSGTLGKPVLVPLTEKDQHRLAYNEWLSMQYMNVQEGAKVQLLLTLDRQFMAGMAYYQGAQKAGATVIRTGPGMPALQWEMIQNLKVDTLVAVPSFLLKMIRYAQEQGIDYTNSSVKKILAIGESIRNQQFLPNTLLNTLEDLWPVQYFSTYAATEMQTAFTECISRQGGHVHPELIIVEILDEDGQAVTPGNAGEVTITTLGIEGMPLFRYRTGDMACLHDEHCPCGRKSARLGPILGRKQQMIKYKGTTIYPPALFDLLQQRPELSEYFVALSSTTTGQDELKIYLTCQSEEQLCREALIPLLKHKLRAVPELQFVSQQTMQTLQFPAESRKQIRFKDYRNTAQS